jgi:hypothetical protein
MFLRRKQQDQRDSLGKRKFKNFQHYLTSDETEDESLDHQEEERPHFYMNKGHPKGLGKGRGKGKKG